MKNRKAKRVLFHPKWSAASGVDIIFDPSTLVISVGGWYDSCVSIEATNLSLKEFFEKLGIESGDCEKIFKSDDN